MKATLVKHPCRDGRRSVVLKVESNGVDLLGRMTPSFRRLYDEIISKLRAGQGYYNCLRDLDHQGAFDLLLEEAWGPEQAAMANSNIPTVLDALNLTANVHNRKMIQHLIRQLQERDQALEELKRRLEELRRDFQPLSEAGGDGQANRVAAGPQHQRQ